MTPAAMNLALDKVCIDIEAKRIVQEVSLKVEPGEIVGLIGPNGSGKSTLLRSVYRMLNLYQVLCTLAMMMCGN